MKGSRLARVLALAAVYVALGRLGQAIALQQVTAVWPPSGVAVAAALFWGAGAVPGVWLGSFVLNTWGLLASRGAAPALGVAAIMAAGAAAEAYLAAFVVRRFAAGLRCLESAGGVFWFALAALASAVVPATLGTAGLAAGKVIPATGLFVTWLTWWLGDVVGILVVTPFLLAFAGGSSSPRRERRSVEALGLALALLAVGAASFFGPYPLEYVFIPCLVWAAFRFGARGATAATLLASTVAIWGTAIGRGPFLRASLSESLLLLQAFLGVVAMTALVLVAVLLEKRQRTTELVSAMSEAREARAAAEESNQAKGILLANMGHELRTPLNHIIGYAELLEEEAPEAGAPSLVPDIRRVHVAAKELLSILQHILELANVGTRKIEMDASTFSLESVVRAAEKAARPHAESRGNTLAVRIHGSPGDVTSDATKLREVLESLLDNACKFTEKGSVTVDVAKERVEGREWLSLAVADTGIGMSEEEIKKLFRAFSQLESGPRRRFRGVGLGLALSRRFCQMMGGDIFVESEPGRGSTFTVRLPAEWRGEVDEEASPVDPETSTITRRRRKRFVS
ncbi:MAG TPA: MASE1 domain-containing protein [Thermoanaerobaculia bacterium]|nr:MASE1 domain-containing protein [Thermoanaerobaculia bacterium]